MDEVVCSRCTVELEEDQACIQAFDADGDTVLMDHVIAVGAERGIDAGVVLSYAMDEYDHPDLPEYTFRSVVMPVKSHVPKAFPGTEEEAAAAGWVVREFGTVCPDCAATEGEVGTTATMEGDNPLVELASAVMLGGKFGARAIRRRKQELAEGLVDLALEAQDE